jgi:tRNA1(Val) A37 N6-methylase TrmN6
MMHDLPQDVRAHRDWLLSLAPAPRDGIWVDLGCGVGADALVVAARYPQRRFRIVGLNASAKNIEVAAASGARALVKQGIVTAKDYEVFVGEQEALSAEGRFFYSITGSAYVGRLQAT